jgi:hypothetical protein
MVTYPVPRAAKFSFSIRGGKTILPYCTYYCIMMSTRVDVSSIHFIFYNLQYIEKFSEMNFKNFYCTAQAK